MTKFVQPPSAVRWIVMLVAIFSLSTIGMAQQDFLDDTKDVIIDEPADKVEDVFDTDDDDDFDADHDRNSGCVLDQDDDDCDLDKDVDNDDCDLDQDVDDDCDLDDYEAEEVEMEKPSICQQTAAVAAETTGPIEVKMSDLEKDPESYYGQTVTVVGELHRIFNDKVFTIEDDGFFKDKDVLVINQGANCADIEACNDEFEPGKDLRITGLVVPYDRGKLECEHGPLNVESREGHSFTKNPVLIVGRTQTAAVIEIEREKPAVVSEPAPEPPPLPEPVYEPTPTPEPEPIPEELPRTASESPLLGLIGALSLCAAFVLRRSAAERSR